MQKYLGREGISGERPIGEVEFLGESEISVKECIRMLYVGAVGVIINP